MNLRSVLILASVLSFVIAQPQAWSLDAPSMRQLQQVVGQLFGTPPTKNEPNVFLTGRDSSQDLCGVRIDRGDADTVVPSIRLEAGSIGNGRKSVAYDQPAIFNDVKVVAVPGGFRADTMDPVLGGRDGDKTKSTLVAIFRGGKTGLDNLDTVSITHKIDSPILHKKTRKHASCSGLKQLLTLDDDQGEKLGVQALKAFSATRGPRARKFDEATYLGDCDLVLLKSRSLGLECMFDLSPAAGDGDEPSILVDFAINQTAGGQAQVGQVVSTEFSPN